MAVGRQFGREATVYLVGFAGMGLIQFASVPVYARALGPEGYGHLTIAVAATAALAGIMALGGDTALARFWPDYHSEAAKKSLASTWIFFLLGWSVVVAVTASVVVAVFGRHFAAGVDLRPLLVISFVGAVPALLSSMLAQILRNRFEAVPYAVSTVVVAAFAVGLGIALGVGLGLGPTGVALGVLLGQLLGVLLRWWLVRDALTARLDRTLLPPLLRFGVPLVPASLSMWVFTGADRIVLGLFGQASDVGAYAVAAAIVGPFTVVNVSVGQAWIPRIVALNSDDPVRARGSTARAVLIALGGLGLAALALGAVAPWVVEIVGGPDYSAGSAALPALSLSAAFAGTAVLSATGLILAKRTNLVTLVTAGSATIGIALLVVLVPLWGPLGAAASVCSANMLLAGWLLRQANRAYHMGVDEPRIAAVVSLLLLQTVVSSLLPGSVWTAVGLACAVAGIVVAIGWRSARATPVER